MRKTLTAMLCILLFLIEVSAQEKVIKILAIGNSFSEDAIENYLSDLAQADNQQIIIGNLYIGGAPISLHVKNLQEDNAAYSYRKIKADGSKTSQEATSIKQAMEDEDWNYISIQQASPFSGMYEVIMEDLPELIHQIQTLKNKNTSLIYHQTWAYQHDSNHDGFSHYQNNQLTMYKAIKDASKKISKMKNISFIIPCGTAIQNARSSSIGDHLTRDGYHLELNVGRFTAACTWYEKLFHKDVRKNSFSPVGLSSSYDRIAKSSAHQAVKKPFKSTKIKL